MYVPAKVPFFYKKNGAFHMKYFRGDGRENIYYAIAGFMKNFYPTATKKIVFLPNDIRV